MEQVRASQCPLEEGGGGLMLRKYLYIWDRGGGCGECLSREMTTSSRCRICILPIELKSHVHVHVQCDVKLMSACRVCVTYADQPIVDECRQVMTSSAKGTGLLSISQSNQLNHQLQLSSSECTVTCNQSSIAGERCQSPLTCCQSTVAGVNCDL